MFERINNLWHKKPATLDDPLSGHNIIQNRITAKRSKDGRTLKYTAINDADIKVRVIAALLDNPQTDRALIRVKSEHGLVTLDGQVNTSSAKTAARLVAGRQKDVRGVVDKIIVLSANELVAN